MVVCYDDFFFHELRRLKLLGPMIPGYGSGLCNY
jgi:hypothetical protein